MNTDAADKRRIAVATLITIVALPALWLSGRDDAGDGTTIAVVGGAGALEATADGSPGTADPNGDPVAAPVTVTDDDFPDPFAVSDPVFLVGPSAPPTPEPQVVYADPGPQRQYTGPASFKRWDPEWNSQACHSPVAPANARLLVTNVNNGRTTTCTNVLTKPLSNDIIIVLDTEAFLHLANLVEAPLPVQISW